MSFTNWTFWYSKEGLCCVSYPDHAQIWLLVEFMNMPDLIIGVQGD